jgi:voltage-gated potassium channel
MVADDPLKFDYHRGLRRWRRRILALWPQWPLGISLMLSGALNILTGLRFKVPLGQITPLTSVADSLSVLGSSTQLAVGVMLVLVGAGLLWRLAIAWSFGVLLLVISIGVNLAKNEWGASFLLPCLMLLALTVLRKYFTRRTMLGNYLISFMSVLAVLAYGTVGSYLLGHGFKPKIHDLTTAFYFTVVTLSTVGYGDITPNTYEARMFAVTLLVGGLSIFAAAIITALGPAISREMGRIFNPRGEIMKPKDHVILVGEGPIAHNTARELISRGIPFVQIVEKGAESSAEGKETIVGDAAEDTVLKEASIDAARMVIAAREDDGENAFIALVAKDLNPQVRVLAVASSAHSIRRLKLARADLVFSPAAVGSRLLANLVEGGEISSEFHDLLEGRAH